MGNENIKNLTTAEKKKGVIDDYDDIAKEYAEELPKTLESFSKVLKSNGKLLLILQEGLGETMIEEPYRQGVSIYMNYFSVETITKLLQEYGFKVNSIGKAEAPNEFELGNGNLILLSSNVKELEYDGSKR